MNLRISMWLGIACGNGRLVHCPDKSFQDRLICAKTTFPRAEEGWESALTSTWLELPFRADQVHWLAPCQERLVWKESDHEFMLKARSAGPIIYTIEVSITIVHHLTYALYKVSRKPAAN